MKKITLMLLAFGFLAVSSCKKEESSSETKTKTELLTAKAWKITAVSINPGITPIPGGPTITDLYAILETCSKDDTEKYNTGGTGVTDEGATKCNPSAPQTENFTWSFLANETQLKYDDDVFNIVQLDATTLKFTIPVDGADIGGAAGTTYTVTTTFKNN
ncbi:MAG: lipocalin family protein [Bacteroidia bacterium]